VTFSRIAEPVAQPDSTSTADIAKDNVVLFIVVP
jgi:hypothetical protein